MGQKRNEVDIAEVVKFQYEVLVARIITRSNTVAETLIFIELETAAFELGWNVLIYFSEETENLSITMRNTCFVCGRFRFQSWPETSLEKYVYCHDIVVVIVITNIIGHTKGLRLIHII